MSQKKTTYEGTSKNGQTVTVFFFDEGAVVKALALSDHLTAIFGKRKDGSWYSYNDRLNTDWGPVVEAIYNSYLSDIISGELDEI